MPDHYDDTNRAIEGGARTNAATDSQADSQVALKTPADPAKRRRAIGLGVLIAVVLLVGCILWWLHARTYESTDDAEIDGNLNPIAARVDGTVKAIYVQDNQRVRAGQPIVDLDTRDAQVNLVQAQADYDEAVAQFKSEVPNLPIQEASNRSDVVSAKLEIADDQAALDAARHDYDSDIAKLDEARATNLKAQSDLVRYRQLEAQQELAQSDFDQYVATAQTDAASVSAAVATVASQQTLIVQRRAQLEEQQAKTGQTLANAPRQILIKDANNGMRAASVESYKAKLEQAKLDVVYCHIVAPVSGVVLERSAEVGSRISTGQQLLMVAQIDDPWVTANFKETQIRTMHPGQHVEVHVDALDTTFTGKVQSMPAATGDRASVLPSENATGNYVKVIQRLPVRIRFDRGQAGLGRLRPGMSVEPKVHLN